MSKTLSSKWIDALRSGKYTQGRGYLKSLNNEYCCLGVLCDVIDPSKWKNGEESPNCFSYQGHDFSPDFLTENDNNLFEKFNNLINLNDDQLYGFPMIANEIQEDKALCEMIDSLDLTKLNSEAKSE